MSEFTHFDETGASRMVDTTAKPETNRLARASGRIRMNPATMAKIKEQGIQKGNVLEVARLAGIMAAKKTGDLIPLCHPLPITSTPSTSAHLLTTSSVSKQPCKFLVAQVLKWRHSLRLLSRH